jgi:transmembrane sensor
MGNYSAYKVEDFLLDESFINWVINNSEKDAIFWEAWVSAHPASAPTVKLAQKTLLALYVKPVRTLSDSEIESMVGNVEQRVQMNSTVRSNWADSITFNQFLSYPIAAVLIMSILMLPYLYDKLNIPAASKVIAYTIKNATNQTGERMLVKLSDGSSVILAPGSKLRYPTPFQGTTRSVSLEGEAFFEVSKDAKHPFFVTSGNLVTRVVGTSFTIKAYNGTKEYRVIVNTGKVLVTHKVNSGKQVSTLYVKPITVVPNQQIVYNVAQKSLIKENLVEPLMLSADVSKDVFTFNDTPLSKVISRIEQAYNVNIIYNEKEIGGCPLTASLAEEHLLEKLDLISKALDVKYYLNDGHIVLTGAGCNKQLTNKN